MIDLVGRVGTDDTWHFLLTYIAILINMVW